MTAASNWFWLWLLVPILIVVWSLHVRRPGGVAKDRPFSPVPWRPDQSVFETPERFGYRVYSKAHDACLEARLIPGRPGQPERARLLNENIEANRSLIEKLSKRLATHGIGKQTSAAVLIDHSGSMNRTVGTGTDHPSVQRGECVAANSGAVLAAGTAASIALALHKCGAETEILGFTTREWRGGQSRRDWVASGRPIYPGRLNDLLHIIYKTADEREPDMSVDRLELMLRPAMLKENIDGEAVEWARSRLLERNAQDRLLIVVSDGVPVDDSTLNENGLSYLQRHLTCVREDIDRREDLRLVAIGIGFDVRHCYQRSEWIDLEDRSFSERADAIAKLLAG